MKIMTIVWEIAFMVAMAIALINMAVQGEGVGTATTVVLISMFAGFGACWRLAHPG
jgi:hypothetical protein